MAEFTIIPILGRKVDVAQNDPSLFQFVADTVALTHDVGGENFDLQRTRNSCTKAQGEVQWSNSANAQATKCYGLAELYDGTNRDHCFWDNGKFYVFDSSRDPQDKTAAATTHNTTTQRPYSIIQVGDYIVWADGVTNGFTPYKWKNGDANATKLIQSGTEFKFRYLANFQRRVIGLYSDQTDGDLDVRWSTSWPGTAITSLNFPAANQLYIPNDDPIVGGKTMGLNKCYIYSENSIHQLAYYPDYTTPFRLYTLIPNQGSTNHHSIIDVGDRHYLFNSYYGFCEYRGTMEFPYGGRPISEDIEPDLQDFDADFYDMIVGVNVKFTDEVAWAVPSGGSSAPDYIYYYNYKTKQWRIENKSARYLDGWRMYDAFTWTNLITLLTNAGYTNPTWNNLLTHYGSTVTWGQITEMFPRLVYGNTDGQLYYISGEDAASGNIDGYRVEPIVDFGDKYRKDILKEIWMDIRAAGSYSIDISHRSGDTVGELIAQSWTSLGSISCDSPDVPVLRNFAKSARLHQIKWGTSLNTEKFEIGSITFKYQPQSRN